MVLRRILLFLIVCCVAVQYSYLGLVMDYYSLLRTILISLVVMLFCSFPMKSYIRTLQQSKLIRKQIFVILFVAVILFCISAFISDSNVVWGPLVDLSIVTLILLISYSFNLSKKEISSLEQFLVYAMSLAALSLFILFDGLTIETLYFPLPKNQIGPVYAFSLILSMHLLVTRKPKVIYMICALILFLVIIIIRARANIVATIISMLLFVFLSNEISKKKKIIFSVSLLLLIPIVGGLVYESFTLGYDVNDMDSLSAGRSNVYLNGLEFLVDRPFWGLIMDNSNLGGIVHNYLLYTLVNYGVILGVPLVCLYLLYWKKIFFLILNEREVPYTILPYMLLVLFIASLFEFSHPFSPVSMSLFPFFLFGQVVKRYDTK